MFNPLEIVLGIEISLVVSCVVVAEIEVIRFCLNKQV